MASPDPNAPIAGLEPGSARYWAAAVLANRTVRQLILTLIILNALVLGLQTSDRWDASINAMLELADRAIVIAFTAEIGLRLFVRRTAFFRDPWNWFDVIVVGTALIPANAPFAVLRALRVLRLLRGVAIVPQLRRVVGAMLTALPGLGATAMVLVLIFYVFAVIGTHIFSNDFPAWFGHVGRSLYTLFQVMTLESWSMGISRPVMEKFPYAWTFFVPFILVSTYSMMNLFIAVIVGATQAQADAEKEDSATPAPPAADHTDLAAEVGALRTEIAELKDLLRHQRAG